MAQAFLYTNALLYLALGLWCSLDPYGTSAWVGFELVGGAGFSEYLAVYGGLELGLAAFFFWAARDRSMQRGGIAFGLCLYIGIFVLRGISATMVDLGNAANTMVIEALMVSWAAWALYRLPSHKTPPVTN
jgi:hypothetical protein